MQREQGKTEAHGLLSAEVPCALTQGIFSKTPQATHLNPFCPTFRNVHLQMNAEHKRVTSLFAEILSLIVVFFFLYIISSTNCYIVASAVHCSHVAEAEGPGANGRKG